MTTIPNSNPHSHESRSQAGSWWRPLLFLGILGLALFLLVAPRKKVPSSTEKPERTVAQQAAAAAQTSGAAKTPFSFDDSHFASRRSLVNPPPEDHWPAGEYPASATQPLPLSQHVWELDALVSKVKNMKVLTEESATDLEHMLQALRKQGAAAVPAISDFLRQGDDVNFTKMSGGELIHYQTLRQALLDTLDKIGGSEALAASLEQLPQTRDPIELAMLARNLENEAPGVHRDEVIQAISNALQWAEQTSAKERPDVGPLFHLLRTYGGEKAVAVLQQSAPQWGEYSLIALADLPKGAGISNLIALASNQDAAVENPVLPFQVLAQAAARHSSAGTALVDLARTGQIPDQAWSEIGEALGGKQLQFSSKMFDGTPLASTSMGGGDGGSSLAKNYYIEWLNIRYEQRSVAAEWSTKQINQELALIDQLRSVASTPAATTALQLARAALQNRS